MKKVLLLCLIAITIIGLVACSQDNKTYRISFDANGGTGEKMADIVAPDHKEVTLAKNTYTRTGYVFTGWSEDKDAYYAYYGDEEVCEFKDDTTLYAVWEADLSSSTWEATTDADHTIRLQFDDKGCFTMSINGTQYGNGDFIVIADDLTLAFAQTEETGEEQYAYFESPEKMDVVIVSAYGDLDPATLDFTEDFRNGKFYYPTDYEIISKPAHQDVTSVFFDEVGDDLLFTTVHATTLTARNYTYTDTSVYTCNTVVPEGKLWTFSIPAGYKSTKLISTEFVYDVTPEKSTLSFYFGRMYIGEYLEFTKVVDE